MKKMLLAIVLILGLAGCGLPEEKISVPKAGQCVADEVKDGDDVAPDLSATVDCTKAHSYEIVATVPIDKSFLVTGSEKKQLARRTELAIATASKQTALGKKFQSVMGDKCNDALFDQVAGNGFTFAGRKPSAAGLGLTTSGANQWINLTSPALWKKGDQRMICSTRFYDTSDDSDVPRTALVKSSDTQTIISGYFSSSFPTRLRSCGYRGQYIGCGDIHDTEYLWTFNASAVQKKIDPAALTKDCAAAYESLGFTANDGSSVAATALTGAGEDYTPYACVLILPSPATGWQAFASDTV